MITANRREADEDEKFDAANNKGEILGFPPGQVVASVMGLFLIPEEVQAKIKKPIDDGANKAQSALHDAQNTLKSVFVHITFLPTIVFYAAACGLSWITLIVLLLDLVRLLTRGGRRVSPLEKVPTAALYKYVPLVAAFFLFLGAMIITVVHFIAKVVDIAAGVVKISVQSGSAFVTMSWLSFLLLVGLGIIARRWIETPWYTKRGAAAGREDGQDALELRSPGLFRRFRQGRQSHPSSPTPQKPGFPGN